MWRATSDSLDRVLPGVAGCRACRSCGAVIARMATPPGARCGVPQNAWPWSQVRWRHNYLHEEFFMATKFGLHGIPVFFAFDGTRKLGRFARWPWLQEWVDATEKPRSGSGLSRELNVSLSAS